MPDRILKASITASESLDNLNAEEECFFYRLLVCVDDYGRFDGRQAVLLTSLYRLSPARVSVAKITAWLKSLQREHMLLLYTVEGKPYLQLTNWNKYQTPRANKSKFPNIPTPESTYEQMQADESTYEQMQADVTVFDIRNSIFDIRNSIDEPPAVSLFEKFWDSYTSVGRTKAGKTQARKAWDKLQALPESKRPDQQALLDAMMRFCADRVRTNTFTPDPAVFLNANNRLWEEWGEDTLSTPTLGLSEPDWSGVPMYGPNGEVRI